MLLSSSVRRVMVVRAYGVAALMAALALFWLAFPGSVGDASLSAGSAHRVISPLRHHPVRDAPAPPDVRSAFVAISYRDLQQREALAVLHDNLWLHAVGAQLYTAWNAPVTLKAINWYGFEYAPFVPGGLDHASLDSILASLHALGFNALRIPFANETVESNPIVTSGLTANPGLRGLHSLDIMQRIVERAHVFGLRVILCNSRSEAGRGPELKTGLWYTSRYPASAWVNDWVALARRFRQESAFVGADLRNEPHITGGAFDENAYFTLGPLWGAYHGAYYHDRDWHYAAETLGNMLLAINPHLLIIVEGVQMYLDPYRNVLTGGLWGANLVGVQYDPIVLSRPGQLVYSVHEYGPHMWQGDWFGPATTYASLARRWDHLWGYLLTASRQLQAPILVGEFGTCHEYVACVYSNQGWKQGFWFRSFVRYLSEHPQVGWAYWALNPDGPFHATDVDFYSLTSLDWKHYYPLVTRGLGPILREPNGVWRVRPASAPLLSPQPGCSARVSCAGGPESRMAATTVRPLRGAPSRSPAPSTAVQIRANVSYVASGDPARAGDLYLPRHSGKALHPAVVIVHGSSWDGGSKGSAETVSLAMALAWHGYTVFDIDYRLAGHGGDFPRDVRDVKAAVDFLAAQAGQLQIDPSQIGVSGSGAGGYLALMAAYTWDSGPFAPRSALPTIGRLAAVAGFFAPVNLSELAQQGTDAGETQALRAYLHAGFQQNPKLYDFASPTTYTNRAIPTIFFQGLSDPNAPFDQTYKFFRSIRQRDVPAQLIDLPGAPHALTTLSPTMRRLAVSQLVSFFDGVFYRPRHPNV